MGRGRVANRSRRCGPWVTGLFSEFGTLGDAVKDGDETLLDDVVFREVPGGASAIDDGGLNLIPQEFALNANYPNPFNPETTIEYSLDRTEEVTLKVYAITGQLVRTLVNSAMEAGSHQVRFNGRDDFGNLLSSGVYFYQLQSAGKIATNKMILMK